MFSAAFTRVLYLDRLYLQYTCFRLGSLFWRRNGNWAELFSPMSVAFRRGLRIQSGEGSHP